MAFGFLGGANAGAGKSARARHARAFAIISIA
jgi:hypothetical protein